ncbi:V-type ATP synthase subunit C [Paratissierella segnis]|jgi:V/A-type H+-transporting ATPase subunit C|uniref:V-type ATP synthase subunit C n=1 Tax=Paratissierella segnis TaxID=2763679 RepID=A0A926IJ92_9FIRM|nr:V-type ATP synthase subunit C [Paratissierella segnis]MBC8586995.1 V-type ATP synthase subunit C [Paratissierella segnis]
MDRMDFVQGVVRTKVIEKRLLSKAQIDRMVDAKDIDEVFRMLNETEYSNGIANISRSEDYEKILSEELKRVYKLMREIAKEDQIVVDLLALKYDYHNLKVLLKEKILNTDLSQNYIPIGTIDIQKLKNDFLTDNYEEIKKEFREALETAIKDYDETNDPQRIDIVLDKIYFSHLYKMAKSTGIELFIEYVEDSIDFINVKTLIRIKKQNKDINFLEDVLLPNGKIDKNDIVLSLNDSIDIIINKFKNYRISEELKKGLESYQETNHLSDFEKYMDDYLMELNKRSKNIIFGPEPIFSYIIAKETEIKVLRIIMVSKLNDLSPEDIRERLRDLYV